jgi:hypothetical protein
MTNLVRSFMDVTQRFNEIERLFVDGSAKQAVDLLWNTLEVCEQHPLRAAALAEIVGRVDHDDPQLASYLALAGGAIVEQGEPARPLGEALVAPIVRALSSACRLLDHVSELDNDDLEEDSDEDSDEDTFEIGGTIVSQDVLDEIAAEDLEAVQSWFSLGKWYLPAVATWARTPALLAEVQRMPALREPIATLANQTETSHWLSILLETVFESRFVVLLPELQQAWSFVADGVVDIGQLSVLVSRSLAGPLRKLGVKESADDEVLAVMRGTGPHQGNGAYGCAFHFYPVQALDPSDGLPKDGVHTWQAPGGSGTHSLPGDFLPGSLPVIDGARVLVLVGPDAPGTRFVRVIGASRMFNPLKANLSRAEQLSPDETRRWTAAALRAAV